MSGVERKYALQMQKSKKCIFLQKIQSNANKAKENKTLNAAVLKLRDKRLLTICEISIPFLDDRQVVCNLSHTWFSS